MAIHESVKLLSFRCFLMNGSHSSYVVNYDMYCIFTKRRKKCIRKVFVSFYQSVANLLCSYFCDPSLSWLPARPGCRVGPVMLQNEHSSSVSRFRDLSFHLEVIGSRPWTQCSRLWGSGTKSVTKSTFSDLFVSNGEAL